MLSPHSFIRTLGTFRGIPRYLVVVPSHDLDEKRLEHAVISEFPSASFCIEANDAGQRLRRQMNDVVFHIYSI